MFNTDLVLIGMGMLAGVMIAGYIGEMALAFHDKWKGMATWKQF